MSDFENTSQETMEENGGLSGPLYFLAVRKYVQLLVKKSWKSEIKQNFMGIQINGWMLF